MSGGERAIHKAIDMLRDLGISVDFTDQPIDLNYARTDEDGRVLATVGLMTVTASGRVFVELYDSGDRVRLTMLEHVAEDVETAVQNGHRSTELRCWLHSDTILELREWAEVRDSLSVSVGR